jgi:hypothetical protein
VNHQCCGAFPSRLSLASVSKNLKYLFVFIGIEILLLVAFVFRDEIWSRSRIPAIMSRNERLVRRFLGDWVYESYIEASLLAMMALLLLVIIVSIKKIGREQKKRNG